jgi:outer membrane usher protein
MNTKLAVAGLCCALGLSGNAWAMEDAHDASLSDLYSSAGAKAELLPIEVVLNDTKVVTQNILRTVKGPAVAVQDLTQARIQYQGNVFDYDGGAWVLLTQIQQVTPSFDAAAARLNLKINAAHLAIQKSDPAPVDIPSPTYIPALISNYDWSSSAFINNGHKSTVTNAVVEHIVSLGALRFNQSWAASSDSLVRSKLTRVDSGVRYDDLNAARTWWVGDNFTSSETWGRAYRLFGIGVQSNFAGRPDKRVLPRPAVSGFVVEPSSYELFLDNKKVGSGQFEAGNFEINNVPTVSSNGDVSVVFKDALGREQVRSVSFFVAPRQLAEDAYDYQFNAGKLRTGFLGDASDYGDWVVSGEYGLGITQAWTMRAASELSKNQANIGLRQVLSLWGRGALTIDTVASKNQGLSGWYVAAQSMWSLNGMRLTLGADKRSKDFWRIGDLNNNLENMTAQREAGVSSSLGFSMGSFGNIGVAAAIEKRFDGTTIKNISANYSKQLSNRAYVNVSGNLYSGAVKSKSLYVMFTYNFEEDAHMRVTTTAQNTDSGTDYVVSASRDATEDLPVALSVSAGKGSLQNTTSAFGLNWTPEVTAINLNLNRTTNNTVGSQTQIFASGTGSITATSYGIFPSARIYDSAVLIDLAGSPKVRTNVNGRSVKTNDAGYALVPNAGSYVQNQAMFEPSDLPLEVGFSSQVAFVTPWPRSVGLVKFDIANTEGESFRVLDKNSLPIKVGSEVLLVEENQFIGRDGYLYLTSRTKDNEVKIKTPESITCTAILPERKIAQPRSEPITVICD